MNDHNAPEKRKRKQKRKSPFLRAVIKFVKRRGKGKKDE